MLKSPEERRRNINDEFPVWNRKTLGTHFSEQAKKYPNRPFLITAGKEYSYQSVWQESVNTAKALLKLGVQSRDHVALLMDNKPEFIYLKIAISLVGAVCIPINTMLQEEELKYTLRQSDTDWLFFQESIKNMNYGDIIARLSHENQLRGEHDKKTVEEIICLTDKADFFKVNEFLMWETFLTLASEISDNTFVEQWKKCEYPDEICDIIYTSGTTGLPKGVMLSHDKVLRCAFSTSLSRAFEDGRRMFTALPMYHVFAYIEGLLAVTFVGGAFILITEPTPRSMLTLMERSKATDFLGVPSMLMSILYEPELHTYNLSHLNSLMCAAAPTPIPVWQEAKKELGVSEICTGYGGTEASASTVHTEIGDSLEVISTRVGRIKPGGSSGLPEFSGHNTQYKIVDPFSRTEINPHTPGELVSRGNFMTNGYYKKSEETAAAIDKDGWFFTGDLGRIDEHGYIEFLGRSKDLYIVSGENVAPKEVEEVISQHKAVKQVFVVGVPNKLTGEIGAAFIELKAGEKLKRRDIVEVCRTQLARYKVPRYVWFLKESDWPYTGNGKLQKFKLVEMAKKHLKSSTD